MPEDAKQRPDPRTRQFLEVAIASIGLLILHVVSIMLAGQSIVSTDYAAWVCIHLPFLSLVLAVILVLAGRWHWGQCLLFMVVALTCSLIQLMIVGQASAAV